MTIRPRLERDEGIKWLLAKRGGLHQQWVTCAKAILQQQSDAVVRRRWRRLRPAVASASFSEPRAMPGRSPTRPYAPKAGLTRQTPMGSCPSGISQGPPEPRRPPNRSRREPPPQLPQLHAASVAESVSTPRGKSCCTEHLRKSAFCIPRLGRLLASKPARLFLRNEVRPCH